MTIRESENLKMLAEAAGTDVKRFTRKLEKAIEKIGIGVDDEANWGGTIEDCLFEETLVLDIVEVLHECGISDVRDYHYDAFMSLVIMGDYDCPECGAEMDLVDGEYEYSGDGYLEERQRVTKWESYICPNCGAKLIK